MLAGPTYLLAILDWLFKMFVCTTFRLTRAPPGFVDGQYVSNGELAVFVGRLSASAFLR